MFGTIKTKLMSLFDEWYAIVSSTTTTVATTIVADATSAGEKVMSY